MCFSTKIAELRIFTPFILKIIFISFNFVFNEKRILRLCRNHANA